MINLNDEDLLARLSNFEDPFVERKVHSDIKDVLKTAVAFANSLPAGMPGVLYMPVKNDGTIQDGFDLDDLQKKISSQINKAYPAIQYLQKIIRRGSQQVVAVLVWGSEMRPHFAGPAYVRRGSQSVAATEQLYRELLLSQDDKRRFLIDNREVTWTVEHLNKEPGASRPLFDTRAVSTSERTIEEVTAFFVRFKVLASGIYFTEMLQDVHISYDDKRRRYRAVIWPTGR